MELDNSSPRPAVLKWLLNSDPAIRWQVMRDLTDETANVVAAERRRVATEGWGAELLAQQSPDGSWGGAKENGGLLITFNCLLVLKDLGLDPASQQARVMLERVRQLRFTWHQNRAFFEGETEPCINGRIVGLDAYFAEPNEALVELLLSEQLADGGWNCEAPKSKVSSFHTTICVLEGLLEHERSGRQLAAVSKARERAEEYLLQRKLFRSLRTGEIVDKRWLRFAFPTFWHYDVLRALDYFRKAGRPMEERMQEAVDVMKRRRHQNGLWPLNLRHPEWIPLEMEMEAGARSRWNTLRALRVLRWATASA